MRSCVCVVRASVCKCVRAPPLPQTLHDFPSSSFSANAIGPFGALELAETMSECRALKNVYLSSALFLLPASRRSLHVFHVTCAHPVLYISLFVCVCVCVCVCCWSLAFGLRFLDNELRAEGARCLARHIPSCHALDTLCLRGTGIGDAGACALASSIVKCHRLRALDLTCALACLLACLLVTFPC